MLPQDTFQHPAVFSQVIVNFAGRLGVDRKTCLDGTDIRPGELESGDGLISRAQEIQLIENLITALPDEPALGFQLGLQYSVSTFGAWGFALRTSQTLRQAAKIAFRYLPLSTAYCRIQQFEESGNFGIEFFTESIPANLRQFLLERDMATAIRLIHELGLEGVKLSGLHFVGPPPDYAKTIENLAGLKPTYHSPRNALTLPLEEANRKLPTYDVQLVKLMNAQCEEQLRIRQQHGVAGQVRQEILGSLGLMASLEEVADTLALSARSLRRRLEEEGTSFRQIQDEERKQIAAQLLKGSSMKIEEVAYHLGYADSASFQRAFRRWHGCSPGAFRKSS